MNIEAQSLEDTNKILKTPAFRWVGGKRRLLPQLRGLLPVKMGKIYYEPFLGGGSVAMNMDSRRAILSDASFDLVLLHHMITKYPYEMAEAVCSKVNTMNKEVFYERRNKFNEVDVSEAVHMFFNKDKDLVKLLDFSECHHIENFDGCIERASLFLSLFECCFNGILRYNSKMKMNQTFGTPRGVMDIGETTRKFIIHGYNLNKGKEGSTTLLWGDYESILFHHLIPLTQSIYTDREDIFVYLDPPYTPINGVDNVKYLGKMFDTNRLKEVCDLLTSYGIKFMLSNSDCKENIDLFSKSYRIEKVSLNSCVSGDSSKRGLINELVIMNY